MNQFTYTAQFGNGVSMARSAAGSRPPTITAGHRSTFGATPQLPAQPGVAGSFGSATIGGTRAPDLVGMLRVDQAWGLFQASVAAHDNHAGYYPVPTCGPEPNGHPDDKWGWAVALASVDQEHPDWCRVTRSTSRASTPMVRAATTSRT